MVKGWRDSEGELHEKVYNIALGRGDHLVLVAFRLVVVALGVVVLLSLGLGLLGVLRRLGDQSADDDPPMRRDPTHRGVQSISDIDHAGDTASVRGWSGDGVAEDRNEET